MAVNYVRTAWRYLVRQPGFTLLNVFGLSIGVAGLLLIGLYLRHELSYENVHVKADRVFRVVVERRYEEGRSRPLAPTSPPLAGALRANVPEIEKAVRLFVPLYTTGRVSLRRENRSFFDEHFFFADPTVFDVFSIPLRRGEAATALLNPGSVILSEAMAMKYFPDEDPLGRTLVLDDSISVEVTAVMADAPSNTHLRPDFLAPYALLEHQYGDRATSWWGWDLIYTYVLLRDGAAPDAVARKIQHTLDEYATPRTSRRGYTYAAELQPLKDIHLYSDREWEITAGGDPTYLQALAIVALFVLVLACVNFVNLSTARASSRSHEIGVRKVLGSGQGRLMLQFLSESVLLSIAAVLLGTGAAATVLPFASDITGTELNLGLSAVPLLFVLALVLGIAAGSYPALYLSSLRATDSLKGGFRPARRGWSRGRNVLVISQFTISIVLTAGTLIVYQQIGYLQSRELGFDDEQVLVVTTRTLSRDLDAVKQELLHRPGIERVAATSGVPGRKTERMQITVEGHDEPMPVQMLFIDEDFAETLGLEMAQGRDFDHRFQTHRTSGFLINQTAAEAFGWTSAVGRGLSWTSGWGTKQGEVVGVVRDFHVTSLRERVEPLVLTIMPAYAYLALRVKTEDLASVVDEVGAWWREAEPGRPFEYAFLDDVFGRVYEREQTQAHVFRAFSILAVMIACIGLFGLAAYTADARTKEISIRKVLGATVLQIYAMMSYSYVRFVVIALVAGIPITVFAMEHWLKGFAYRIAIGPRIFLITSALMLGVALVTVGWQSVRAALADPVDSLRSE